MNSNGQTYSYTFKSCLQKNLDQSRFFLLKEMLVSRSGLAIFLNLLLNSIQLLLNSIQLLLNLILFVLLFIYLLHDIFFLACKFISTFLLTFSFLSSSLTLKTWSKQ